LLDIGRLDIRAAFWAAPFVPEWPAIVPARVLIATCFRAAIAKGTPVPTVDPAFEVKG
jgi:hypothetical protein